MKKPEIRKEKKEIKKKPVVLKKKSAAPKVKKESKKAAPSVEKEIKEKKAPSEQAIKIEAAKPIPHEKTHITEERKSTPEKKRPPKTVQYHGTGGRKTSGARVWLTKGTGNYFINGRPLETYTCGRKLLNKVAMEPFALTGTLGKFDVRAYANGGGICSQIGAVREAVSEAIISANPELRPTLRKSGLLTRDPRMKERKKYGQKRARKRFQYSKR